MKKGLFFSDIDGTLLRGDAGLTPAVTAAARDFMAAGGLLSLCTGRSLMGTLPVADELGVNAPGIVFGGAAIYDFAAGAFLWSTPCDDSVLDCARLLLDDVPEVGVQAFTLREVYLFRPSRRLLDRGNRVELAASISPPFTITEPVMKLLLTADDPALLESCARFFPREKFGFAFASRNFAEVAPAGASKGDTAARLAALLGVAPEDCFSAGDGQTDMPMFRFSGLSFAPANAPDAVRAAADTVIPAAEQGGMAEAFRHAVKSLEAQ